MSAVEITRHSADAMTITFSDSRGRGVDLALSNLKPEDVDDDVKALSFAAKLLSNYGTIDALVEDAVEEAS